MKREHLTKGEQSTARPQYQRRIFTLSAKEVAQTEDPIKGSKA